MIDYDYRDFAPEIEELSIETSIDYCESSEKVACKYHCETCKGFIGIDNAIALFKKVSPRTYSRILNS